MKIQRHKIFTTFATRLGLYNGLLFQSNSHLNDIMNIKKQWSKGKTGFFLGTHLTIKNYLKGKREFIHTYQVDRKNISATIDIFNMHFANFCIAQSFEAFETFLKDIIAYKIHTSKNLPEKAAILKGKSFKQCRNNIDSICRQKNKHNKKLFGLIKILSLPSSPQLTALMNQLDEWYIVLTEIRHSIVHSNSQLKSSITKDWSAYQIGILKMLLLKKEKGNIYIINCSPECRQLVETVAMHGQLIYDRLDIAT